MKTWIIYNYNYIIKIIIIIIRTDYKKNGWMTLKVRRWAAVKMESEVHKSKNDGRWNIDDKNL